MARKSFVLLVMGTMIFFLCSVSSADVPDSINYQGKLTTAQGGCMNDTVSMTFSIYSDDQGTVVDWTETQNGVIVKEGIFNVLLGSVTQLPASVFDGSVKYLGVRVGLDQEMRPLKPMVTTSYAFRSLEADTAEYARAAPAMPDDDWVIDGDNIYRELGNVGIGITNPSTKLEVSTWMRVTNATSSVKADLVTDANAVWLQSFTDHPVYFATNNAPAAQMALTTSGDVGIGTTSPAERLDVAGTAQMTGFKLPTGASNGYVLTSDASGVGTWQPAGGAGDNDWTFRITDTADTTLITGGAWGIARYGNILYGNGDSTHVNLGVACTTGTSGQNYKYCTIGGGLGNTASAWYSTVGGGVLNTASAWYSTVGGGYSNAASGSLSTVGGGESNTASGNASVVSGGVFNKARGDYSVVSGGGGATAADSNLASGGWSAIGGGRRNTASETYSTVGGGYDNTASGNRSTVGGGGENTASDHFGTVGGGANNTTSNYYSTVGGGWSNTASGSQSTVGGGRGNAASGSLSTVGGGRGNTASQQYSTVGGGAFNTASYYYSTVGGGWSNTASATYSTVGGGYLNTASVQYSTVGGGYDNTASGNKSTVGGGSANTAAGSFATVPGGLWNDARGDFSFAVGSTAKANHAGSVVIAANAAGVSSDSVRSGGNEQMVLRADGGLYITNTAELAPYDNSNIITTRGGAYLSGNGTVWTNNSDRNLKENFRPVNGQELLEKIAQLPITRWNYKEEDDNVTHIGPVAQDFYALFRVGSDDKSISSIDPAGIALAAIQELYKSSQKQRTEIEQLKTQVNQLQELVQKLLAERENEQTGENMELGMK